MSTLFSIVKEQSRIVDMVEQPFHCRTAHSVLAAAMYELGKLAEEVNVRSQFNNATQDSEVVNESVNVLICVLDLIHKVAPNLSEADLAVLVSNRGLSWVNRVAKRSERYAEELGLDKAL